MSGTELAATRHLLGLSQQDLADLLKVNRYTVRDWERGKHEPRAGVLHELELLRREHTEAVDVLAHAAADGEIIGLPQGPKPSGWYLAIGARILDRVPDAQLEWHA